MRQLLKRASAALFAAFDRVGIHVLPKHFYAPVPDRAWLKQNPQAWRRRIAIVGVEWNLDAQLSWLEHVCGPYYGEVAGLREFSRLQARGFGPGFGQIESQVLHCVVRSLAPARVTEVGGGMTTAVMVEAGARNAEDGGTRPEIVTIEPFPSGPLLELGGARIVREGAQTAPSEHFSRLVSGDLLFIDSTHVLKTGSELARLYLEIVPSLAPGVLVHVHDITLPYLYPSNILSTYFDWQESALVLALLSGNTSLRVLCCESALHTDRPGELRRILRDYRPAQLADGLETRPGGHFPSSLWLEVR